MKSKELQSQAVQKKRDIEKSRTQDQEVFQARWNTQEAVMQMQGKDLESWTAEMTKQGTTQLKDEEESLHSKMMPTQFFVSEEEQEKKPMQAKVAQKAEPEDEELVQGKFAQKKSATDNGNAPIIGGATTTKMPEDVQAKMENSFGTDFGNVNIHKDDSRATKMGAQAYTQENEVHFAPGQYNPSSQKGQELLGHELTHVVQQKAGRVRPIRQGKGLAINDSPALEKEADILGARAAKGVDASGVTGKSNGIQKKKMKKVSSKAINRLNKAKEAIKHTKEVFEYGAGNQKDALKKTKFNSYFRLDVLREESYWTLTPSARVLANANHEAYTAAKADIAKGGNCGEHAQVAFDYLRVAMPGEVINRADVTGLDHAFVIMGQIPTESDNELTVADPWPTKATPTLWEDHFAYTNDKSKINTRNSMVADGQNVKAVIAAGLTLNASGQTALNQELSGKETKKEINKGMGNWIWDHSNTAGKGTNYNYYSEDTPWIKKALYGIEDFFS